MMRLRCGGICNDQFVTQSLLSLVVKELRKSTVNIWRSYEQEYSVLLFSTPGYYPHERPETFRNQVQKS